MDYYTLEKRVNGLRRRCQDVKVENRKFLETMSKPKVYQLETEEDDDVLVEDDNDKDTIRLLNTSLRDMENIYGISFDKVQGINGDSLAKFTFDKELKSVAKIRSENPKVKNIDIMVKNLNDTSKKRYMIRKSQINSSKINENDTSNGSFINIKNKQFNDKLNRERRV